jgi:4-aminobutyrate aminotransferase-like enzyme
MRQGLLLCYTGRESIKIGPPLTITVSALKEGLSIIEKSIGRIFPNEYH